MTKFVILGSCRFEPYEILAVPEKVPGLWNTEEGYKISTEKFHPAMDDADVIIAYIPDGVGKHTQMDIDYADLIGKPVYVLVPLGENMREFLLGREFDIANGEADLGMLKDLFKATLGREPRDTLRCPKCNDILKDIYYAIEDRYPFEGWRGRCPTCKRLIDVEDPE